MRPLSVILFALLIPFLLTSCIKCEQCTATDENGKEIYRAESCGKKSVRDQGIENCENMAEINNGECACVKTED